MQLGCDRAGDLCRLPHRLSEESDAVTHGVEGHLGRVLLWLRLELVAVAGEMEFGPLRARQRPGILVADDEFLSGMADIELPLWLLVPAVLLALKEIAEELLLQIDAVVGVVMRPVFDAVHFEPFLLGGWWEEAFEIPARMQGLPAPVRRRQKRHFHLRPVRQHRLVVIVVERMLKIGLAEIVAVGAHLLLSQRFGARYPVAVHAAAVPSRAKTVLHALHLHVVPVLRECVVDAAVVGQFTVEVGEALPDADGREVLGLQARDLPLIDRVVGNAAQAYFAVRPGLDSRPFDAMIKVPCLTRRPMLDIAGRASAAARIYAHDHVAVRHPLFRIADFPALIFVGGARHHVRMLLFHALPGGLVAVLEVQPLAVGSVAEDDRIASLLDWAKYVAAQHQAIVHGDGHVPINAHAVADLTHIAITHSFLLLEYARDLCRIEVTL